MPIHGLRFDVNCSILFTELPLLQRVGLEYRPDDPADSSTSFGWRKAHAG